MIEIIIFYGPRNEFSKILDEENYLSLSKLVRDIDSKKNHFIFSQEKFEPVDEKVPVSNLVVFSDEYMSVNEHVILNFDGFIVNNLVVERIYLHNPPLVLKDKMEKTFDNVTVKHHKYEVFTRSGLIEMYNNFDNNIIGQSSVKDKLFGALLPLTRGKSKPIILLLLGNSGIGKTETAKFLAKNTHGELFRRQCSMFQNQEFLTYLFGGKHNEKCFAKELLERDSNVILLDEFDKAPSVFHSAFYQFFDEGLFEDKNYLVKLDNSIVICTTNYTSLEEVRKKLGIPIFSRINACIKYNELDELSVVKIFTRIVKNEFSLLSDEEKQIVSVDEVLSILIPQAKRLKNVRSMKNIIRELISVKIIKKWVAKD